MTTPLFGAPDPAPTIHVTNATSRRPPHRGPGRVLTIMAAPRHHYGECGEGAVDELVPPLEWVRNAKAGTLSIDAYRALYVARLAALPAGLGNLDLRDGDTLICACSREVAAQGRCHRVWAAVALADAGWTVLLDGVPVREHVGVRAGRRAS